MKGAVVLVAGAVCNHPPACFSTLEVPKVSESTQPSAGELFEAQLVALAVHFEQGGSLAGVPKVLKHVALELGLDGAQGVVLPTVDGGTSVRQHADTAREAVAAAVAVVEQVWRLTGLPEAAAAAAGLEAAQAALEDPQLVPVPARWRTEARRVQVEALHEAELSRARAVYAALTPGERREVNSRPSRRRISPD